MKKEISNYFPNWVDGMLIKKDHFIQTENALQDLLKDNYSFECSAYRFGLLEPAPGKDSSLDLIFRSEPNSGKITIQVNECRAITRGGARVEIIRNQHPPVEMNMDLNKHIDPKNENENSFYILLSINYQVRKGFGEMNPAEQPPRLPYVTPEHKLGIAPVGSIEQNGLNEFYIILGKINYRDKNFLLEQDYFPPCYTFSAIPKIREVYKKISALFTEIEANLLLVTQKSRTQQSQGIISENITFIFEKLIFYLSIKSLDAKHPEFYSIYDIFKHITGFLRVLYNFLTITDDKEKENLLSYLREWDKSDTVINFNDRLKHLSHLTYQPIECKHFLEPCIKFLNEFNNLLLKLNELKLIGSAKEAIIVREYEDAKVSPQRDATKKQKPEDAKPKGDGFSELFGE